MTPIIQLKRTLAFSSAKVVLCCVAAVTCAFTSRAFATAGDLYVSDLATNSILVYKPNGTSRVLASGFDQPQGLAFDQEKNLYVADKGSGKIFKVTLGGTKTVFASDLQSPVGLAFIGGALLVAEKSADRVTSITQSMEKRVFQAVTAPIGVAAQTGNEGIRYITNIVSVLQISSDGSSTDLAPRRDSINVAGGPDNDVFVSTGAGTVLQVTPDGALLTLISGLTQPTGLAFRPARFSGDTAGVGNLYIADPASGLITEVPKVGSPTTFASGVRPNFLVFEVNSPTPPPTPSPTATPKPTPNPTPTPTPAPGILQNISTRAQVLTGDKVLIGGFIVQGGTMPKKLIIRAIGPSLSDATHPVANSLADPVLELHKPNGSVVTNNNWKDTQEQAIKDSGVAPTNDLESAIVATLDPVDPSVAGSGQYTAVMRGKNGGTGVALLEIFDLDDPAATTSELANLSTRGLVETADNVLIAGFIVGPPGNDEQILIRALGPSLPAADVADPLADPTLELHNEDGLTVAFNDNWQEGDKSGINATGLAPSRVKESAILANLLSGNYTAIARGAGDTSGVALVEVYHLDTVTSAAR